MHRVPTLVHRSNRGSELVYRRRALQCGRSTMSPCCSMPGGHSQAVIAAGRQVLCSTISATHSGERAYPPAGTGRGASPGPVDSAQQQLLGPPPRGAGVEDGEAAAAEGLYLLPLMGAQLGGAHREELLGLAHEGRCIAHLAEAREQGPGALKAPHNATQYGGARMAPAQRTSAGASHPPLRVRATAPRE